MDSHYSHWCTEHLLQYEAGEWQLHRQLFNNERWRSQSVSFPCPGKEWNCFHVLELQAHDGSELSTLLRVPERQCVVSVQQSPAEDSDHTQRYSTLRWSGRRWNTLASMDPGRQYSHG